MQSVHQRTALIIEDSMELGYIYGVVLQMANFTFEQIFDGAQALTRLEGVLPDVIILDINLPGVSGDVIFDYLRSEARFGATPIIIATANSVVAEKLSEKLGEHDHLLIKPVSPTQLRALVKGLYA